MHPLEKMLADAQAQAQEIMRDPDLTPEAKAKRVAAVRGAAAQKVRSLSTDFAEGPRRRSQAAADKLTQAERAHNDGLDYGRLAAVQTEVRSQAARLRTWSEIQETIKRGASDPYVARAWASVGVETLEQRAAVTGDPLHAFGSHVAGLRRSLDQRVSDLEPETLRTARAEAQATQQAEAQALHELQDISRHWTGDGAPNVMGYGNLLNDVLTASGDVPTTTTTEISPGHWVTERTGGLFG